ncbi:MAG: hypothetical protein M3Y56_07175 [Armatimonadota bacterium]|nr:hypothetical protein [Armatimonadota bacterium]
MATTLVKNPSLETTTPPRKKNPLRFAPALACLLAATIFRSATGIDQAHQKIARGNTSGVVGGQWLAGMLLGFREAVADLMWIRVDQYFHEGRYDKIMPLCYIITAMEPDWIDVYTTGAWHLGYNFGDRRLVPSAVAFDRRGVDNNPENSEMWYELGWMQWTRGYDFKDAARDFAMANKLKLMPVGRRHALAHAIEANGDIDGALRVWKGLERADDPVPKKWIFLLNMRRQARQDLGKHPVQIHMSIKLTRKGPRVFQLEGITNLPKYSKIYFDLRDADWRERAKQPVGWRMGHQTLYSQTETTLQPSTGIFQGEQIDFYQETLRIHQGDKSYDQYPTEPLVPVKDGHMQVGNGYFKTTIDMAKNPEQYPLESDKYELSLFVNPRMEPITTQDVIGWNGEGMSGPLVHEQNGVRMIEWTRMLSKSDILGNGGK